MIVYKVINKINGKIYIGYTTKTLEERKRMHRYKSQVKNISKYNFVFLSAIRKYGFENFNWEVIHTCSSKEECCEKEIYYIGFYNSISPNGYNLTKGGNGGIQSEETKLKISNSVKVYYQNNPYSFENRGTKEENSKRGKKAFETRKLNNNIREKGFIRDVASNIKQSKTKNELNRKKWINLFTGEEVFMSQTEIAKYTELTSSTYSHILKGRMSKTKSGWTLK